MVNVLDSVREILGRSLNNGIPGVISLSDLDLALRATQGQGIGDFLADAAAKGQELASQASSLKAESDQDSVAAEAALDEAVHKAQDQYASAKSAVDQKRAEAAQLAGVAGVLGRVAGKARRAPATP